MGARITRFLPCAMPGGILGIVLCAVLLWPAAGQGAVHLGGGVQVTGSGKVISAVPASPVPPDGSGSLIAPRSMCGAQERIAASDVQAERAMQCLIDYARQAAGLGLVVPEFRLTASADRKARDILRCGEFSHSACERPFEYWIEWAGYFASGCWQVAENLAWGVGWYGTARSIFRALMASPEHRPHILNGRFRHIGVGRRVGFLFLPGTRVWVQHFGDDCLF